MCGRYSLTSDISVLSERFDFDQPDFPTKPRYNIAPSQRILVVTKGLSRQAGYFEWGIVPDKLKSSNTTRRVINLRAENLHLDDLTGSDLRRGRCLVLADSFFEWGPINGRRRPNRIGIRDLKPFAFAGIWQSRPDQNGLVNTSCSIVTCESNDIIETIHHRMPVILTIESEATWLNPEVQTTDALRSVLVPYSSELMERHMVSDRVNSPANDDPGCLIPLTY